MFEEDHPESPSHPKKKVSTVVMLAAGGVVVATVFATLASMLAIDDQQAKPQPKAEVVETFTSTSVAPDGSTSTVVVTVSTRPSEKKATEAGKPLARPEEKKPDEQKPQAEQPNKPKPPAVTTTTQSSPPTSWTPPDPTTSSSTTTATTTTTTPSAPSTP